MQNERVEEFIPEEKPTGLAGEMEALRVKLKETLGELPAETFEEGELEELPGVKLSTGEFEDDNRTFGEGVVEEGLEEFHERVFKEEEIEELAERAVKVLEEFTGEPMREKEEIGVKTSPERPMQDVLSGAIKELVGRISTKIFTQLTDAMAAAVIERIEKTVEKVVPELAEEAVKKEIRR